MNLELKIRRMLWFVYAAFIRKVLYSAKRIKKENDIRYFNLELRSFVVNSNILFVHVPKAAGTSIVRAIYNREDWTHLTLKDYKLLFDDSSYKKFKIFTVVRNPYDRILSAYNYLRFTSVNEFDKKWASRYIGNLSFDDFVLKWINKKNVENCLVDHFKTQISFITNRHNQIELDYVVRFEQLNEHKKELEEFLEIKLDILHINKSIRADGYENWNPEVVRRINKVYAEDFNKLNYPLKKP